MFDVQLLRTESLTKMVNDFKDQGSRILDAGIWARRSEDGDSFSWDIKRVTRDIASFEGRNSPAGTVKMEVIAQRSYNMIRSFKEEKIPGTILIQLRNPGSEAIQKIAADAVGRAQLAHAKRLDRQNEFLAAKGLTGVIAVVIDGVAHNIDYAFTAANKWVIGGGGGNGNIPLSWANPGANIIEDIQNMKQRVMDVTGWTLRKAIATPEIVKAMLRNDDVRDYLSRTPQGAEMMRTGQIGEFMGLIWTEHGHTYKQEGGSPTRFIPANRLILTPEADPEWAEFVTGCDVAVTDAVPRMPVKVQGRFSYADGQINPPSLVTYAGEKRIPAIYLPDVIINADVLAA